MKIMNYINYLPIQIKKINQKKEIICLKVYQD